MFHHEEIRKLKKGQFECFCFFLMSGPLVLHSGDTQGSVLGPR